MNEAEETQALDLISQFSTLLADMDARVEAMLRHPANQPDAPLAPVVPITSARGRR